MAVITKVNSTWKHFSRIRPLAANLLLIEVLSICYPGTYPGKFLARLQLPQKNKPFKYKIRPDFNC